MARKSIAAGCIGYIFCLFFTGCAKDSFRQEASVPIGGIESAPGHAEGPSSTFAAVFSKAFELDYAKRGSEPVISLEKKKQEFPQPSAAAQYSHPLPNFDSLSADYILDTDEVRKSPVSYAAPSSEDWSSKRFFIEDYGPQGRIPSDVTYPSIYILFSQPAVPLAALGEPAEVSSFVEIKPPLEGVFRWYGTSMLSFECRSKVIPQQRYTVTVSENLTSMSGKSLSGTRQFSFETERLVMTGITPGYADRQQGRRIDSSNVPVEAARSIGVSFSWPVNAAVVQEFLSVRTGEKKYGFSVEQKDPRTIILNVSDYIPPNEKVTVTLEKGARSELGYLGTESSQSKSFHTLRPFKFDESNIYGKTVYLRFSEQADISNLEDFISTEPPMEITKNNMECAGRTVILRNLPFDYEQEFKIRIDGGLRDIYGQELGAPVSLDMAVPPASAYVNFERSGISMLEAQFAPKMIFDYRNISAPSYYTLSPLQPDMDPATVTLAETKDNKRHFGVIDFAPYMDGSGYGMVGVGAHFSVGDSERRSDMLVQVTNLGATVRFGVNKAVVMVTDLAEGNPVEGAEVNVYYVPQDSEYSGKDTIYQNLYNGVILPESSAPTGKDGLAVIPFSAEQAETLSKGKIYVYVEVIKDGDRIFFIPDTVGGYRYGIPWSWSMGKDKPATLLFTDRKIYRPGEKMSYKGIDRTLLLGKYLPYIGGYTLQIEKAESDSEPIYEEEGETSESGGLWGSYVLPENLPPGTYRLVYTREGKSYREWEYFQVSYFEQLAFETSAATGDKTYYRGDSVEAKITASYLGGGALSGAKYEGDWFRRPVMYTPPNESYEGFTFGRNMYGGKSYLGGGSGALSAKGSGSVSVRSGDESIAGQAFLYEFESRVTDAGNQMIGAHASATVHPAGFYIGVGRKDSSAWFAEKGKPLSFEYVLLTPEGERTGANQLPKNGRLSIELQREEWNLVQQQGVAGQVNSRYVKEMVSEGLQDIKLSDSGKFSVTPPKAGYYTLLVRASDTKGREAVTEYSFYASGSDWVLWGSEENAQAIDLVPEKDMYVPGDTARILMQSPLPAGKYLITVERDGIYTEEVKDFNGSMSVIEVPIADSYVPVVYVSVSSYSVRQGPPAHSYDTPDMDKPKGYYGVAALNVDPRVRAFNVGISPDKDVYKPGEKVRLQLNASKDGKAVSGAELTVMVVNRGVLDLVDYHVPDPIAFFYSNYNFPLAVKGGDSRSLLMDPVTYEVRNLFGGDFSSKDDEENTADRKNFDPTAYFTPCVVTDSEGAAVCEFTLPDSLTAYRISVVGTRGDMFSLNEAEIDVRNDLNVRGVKPRKLRIRDTAETGVIIQNLDTQAHTVSVEMQVISGTESSGLSSSSKGLIRKAGKALAEGKSTASVRVEPGQSVPALFYISAQEEGWVTLRYTIKSDILKENLINTLEIQPDYVYETVATVGQIDGQGSKEQLVLPSFADEGRGAFSVQLDATRLGLLKEAVQYVFRYPYGCLEQRSAAALPLALFGEYIDVFGLENEISDINTVLKAEAESWISSMNDDGGLPYWKGGPVSNYGVSVRIGEALAILKEKGFELPPETDDACRRLASYLRRGREKCSAYLRSYSLYVEERLGSPVDSLELERIFDNRQSGIAELAYAGLAYLSRDDRSGAQKFAAKIRLRMHPTVRGVDIDSVKPDTRCFFENDSENYALILKLFSALDSSDQMNERLLFELLQKQRAGNGLWQNTAVTARVLDAIASYIDVNNLTETDIRAFAELAGKPFIEAHFTGAGAKPAARSAPLDDSTIKDLPRDVVLPLDMKTEGSGSVFYTASLKYALPAELHPARDEGISVYLELTDAENENTIANGKLTAGRTYRAKIRLSSSRDRSFVALRVPIPSGCEILDKSLKTTASYSAYKKDEDENYSRKPWNIEIYDNEMQYFWNTMEKGETSVSFLFRAVRSGIYPTPPVQAECMYEPEIFGRSEGMLYTIEE